MRMLVLAGGFGSRLREVVSAVPKPLASVAGTPFLRYQIESWLSQGVRSFVFLLYHQAELISNFIDDLRSGLLSGCDVECIIETVPLDTAGAVAHAVKHLRLNGEFIVVNADTWLDSGIQQLSVFRADAIAVVSQRGPNRYGRVDLDIEGNIFSFLEKDATSNSCWINAGISILKADHFCSWDGKAFSLEKHVFPQLVQAGLLRAFKLETNFIDIGIPEDYLRFCRWVEGGREGSL